MDRGSAELLNTKTDIRMQSCPHCQKSNTLISHGYSHGYKPATQDKEIRRIRFFALTGTVKRGAEEPSLYFGILGLNALLSF